MSRSPPQLRGFGRIGFIARRAVGVVLVCAASGVARSETLRIDSFQQEAGLDNLAVLCLAQSPEGRLWLGTEDGLYVFDGFHVRREPLPEQAGVRLREVVADGHGGLWIASERGLWRRSPPDSTGASWREVRGADGQAVLLRGPGRMDLDASGTLHLVDERHRVLTVTEAAGAAPSLVARADGALGGAVADASGPESTLKVSGSALWIGCGRGLCRWEHGARRRWGVGEGLPEAAWVSMNQGPDGTLWARSPGWLAWLRPGADRFSAVPAPPVHLWPRTIATALDADGRLLTASDEGIARWDGHQWQSWSPRDGLPETAVRSLLLAGDGSLWFGTVGRGLHHWVSYERARHWTEADGLPGPVVWDITRDGGGRLCVATSKGVAVLDEAVGRFRPVVPTGESTTLARDADGAVWWTTSGLEQDTLYRLAPGAPQAEAMIAEKGLGNVYRGAASLYLPTHRGLTSIAFDGRRARLVLVEPPIPARRYINGLFSAGQDDWLLDGQHAYHLQGGHWQSLDDEGHRPLTLSTNATLSARGELWTTGPQGIEVYALGQGIAHPLRHYEPALYDHASALFVHVDGHDRAWIGTDRGLFVIDHGQWHRFDRRDGLIWNDIDEGAWFDEGDRGLWIGTSAGLTWLRTSAAWRPPPRLRLDRLEVDGQERPARPGLEIAWSERRMLFDLGTPDVGQGRALSVEYRLDAETRWHTLDGGSLLLDGLDSGAHRLALRAGARPAGGVPGPELDWDFSILPPWWRSRPAVAAGCALATALWLGSVAWLRLRARRRQAELERAIADRTLELKHSHEALQRLGQHNERALEEERLRVARELHDELGQQLAALRMEVLVHGMRARTGHSPEQGIFDVLVQRLDLLVTTVRTVVSQLRPPALDGGLEVGLEWLVGKFRRDSGLACSLVMHGDTTVLPAELTTAIFRTVQESLTNISKHARASRAEVALLVAPGRINLSVRDDGVGFDPMSREGGFGLIGMRERANSLGGRLDIDSAPGRGTEIRVSCAW
jgi:signal transduction histidine kinase